MVQKSNKIKIVAKINIHITVDGSVAAAVKIRFGEDTSNDGSATEDGIR